MLRLTGLAALLLALPVAAQPGTYLGPFVSGGATDVNTISGGRIHLSTLFGDPRTVYPDGSPAPDVGIPTNLDAAELPDGRFVLARNAFASLYDPATRTTRSVGGFDYFSGASEVAVLAGGRLVVVDNTDDFVDIFDGNGGFLYRAASGYVADVVALPDGRFLIINRDFFSPAYGEVRFFSPDGEDLGLLDIVSQAVSGCVLSDGTVLVGTQRVIFENGSVSRRLERYALDGTYLGLFGALPTASGSQQTPEGCTQSPDGRVIVAGQFQFVAAFEGLGDAVRTELTQRITDPAPGDDASPVGLVSNPTDETVQVRVVTLVTEPNGRTTRVNNRGRRATLAPHSHVGPAPLARWTVPADAAPGTYTVTVRTEDRVTGDVLASTSYDVTVSVAAVREATTARATTEVLGAHPNPFSGRTEVRYALDEAGPVDLRVYDLAGREVAVLADGTRAEGVHAATFDGSGLPAGVYVWRLVAGGTVETGRVTLVR